MYDKIHYKQKKNVGRKHTHTQNHLRAGVRDGQGKMSVISEELKEYKGGKPHHISNQSTMMENKYKN